MADMTKRENLAAAGEARNISELSVAKTLFAAAQELRPEGDRETWEQCGDLVKMAYLAGVGAFLAKLRKPDDRTNARFVELTGHTPEHIRVLREAFIDAIGDET